MYIPRHFEETDPDVLRRLIRAHPLGAWVAAGERGLDVNHVPFLVDTARGACGTLVGHVARANPVWRTAAPSPCVVVFQGPQAYVSPSWYASKEQGGTVVPTWNYAVVHAHGLARFIHDKQWLLRLVERLTEQHETGRAAPWKVADAPAAYIDGLLAAIVGVEIPIDRLEGKWKASQNRPSDTTGIVAGLRGEANPAAGAMADVVKERAIAAHDA